jgi:anti-sigma-K factor RskA
MTDITETHPDPDSLLGAYVLDALDADERRLVEDHLARDPRARAEVDDLRETAAVLAVAPLADEAPPPDLWERISAHASAASDPAVVDELASRRARRNSSRAVWVASAVAGVAAAVALVLGLQVVALNNDVDDAETPSSENIAAEFERATEMDGARETALLAGAEVARVVLLPDGTGYLVNDQLEPLDTDETYQLWALVDGEEGTRVISAGVLGPEPTAASFTVDGPVAGFALTIETAGGVPTTEQEPFAVGQFA